MTNQAYFDHKQSTTTEDWCKAADWAIEASGRTDLDRLVARMTDKQLGIFKAFADGFEGDYLIMLIQAGGYPHETRMAMLEAKEPGFERARQLTDGEIARRSTEAQKG